MTIGLTDLPSHIYPPTSVAIRKAQFLYFLSSLYDVVVEKDVVFAVRFTYSLTSIFRHTSSCLDLSMLKFLSSQTKRLPSLYIILPFFFFPRELIANDATILCVNFSSYSSRVSICERVYSYFLKLFKISFSLPFLTRTKKRVDGKRNPFHLARIPVTDNVGFSASCS